MKTDFYSIFTYAQLFAISLTSTWAVNSLDIAVEVETGDRVVRIDAWDGERWQPSAQAYLNGKPGTARIQVPEAYHGMNLRVLASSREVPAFATRLTHNLPKPGEQSDIFPAYRFGGDLDSVAVPDGAVTEDAEMASSIEESDIWRFSGDRIYIFNQRRGLQIIHNHPDEPLERLSTFRLPAMGSEMYLLGNDYVLLILQGHHGSQTSLAVIDVTDDQPVFTDDPLELEGHYMDSRLVDGRLHVVTRDFNWQVGDRIDFRLYSVDLTDPLAPVVGEPNSFGSDRGWSMPYTLAHPRNLFLALPTAVANHWQQRTDLAVFDWSAELGVIYRGTIPLAGLLKDKFKLHVDGDVLVTVTERRSTRNWMDIETVVETWDLADPEMPLLDSLVLAPEETLFATHFDGQRVYVVTFLIIDPLFVIDFSDPREIRNLGELEVPGYSTWMQLDGDYLVSVGVEDWRVAVSIFNVADPANMFLQSRAYVGDGNGHSWSEGNYDERAITLDRAGKRIMLPFQSYSAAHHGNRGIALFSYADGNVAQTGAVQFDNAVPRRANVNDDRWTAFSETDLIAGQLSPGLHVDDRIPLAWNVHALQQVGDYVYQFGDNNRLYLSTKDDPDQVIAVLPRPVGNPAGVTLRGDQLHLLYYQTRNNWRNPQELRHEVWSVTDPREPEHLGTVVTETGETWSQARFRAAGEGPDVLWVTTGGMRYYFAHSPYLDFRAEPGMAIDIMPMPWFNWQDYWFVWQVDTSVPENPQTAFRHFRAYPNGVQAMIEDLPYLYVNTHVWQGQDDDWQGRDDSSEKVYPNPGVLPGQVMEIWHISPDMEITRAFAGNVPGSLHSVETLEDGWQQINFHSTGFDYITLEKPPYYRYVYKNRLHVMAFDGVQLFPVGEITFGERDYQTTFSWGDGLGVSLRPDAQSGTSVSTWFVDWSKPQLVTGATFDWDGSVWMIEHLEANHFVARDGNRVRWWHVDSRHAELVEEKLLSSSVHLDLRAGQRIGPRNELWIPTGHFGVERFDWQPLPILVPMSMPVAATSDAETWRELPPHRWTTVQDDTAGVGRLIERRWVFRETGWTPFAPEAEDLGDNRFTLAGFGSYFDPGSSTGWIHHNRRGWLKPAGDTHGGRVLQRPDGDAYWMPAATGHSWAWNFRQKVWTRIGD